MLTVMHLATIYGFNHLLQLNLVASWTLLLGLFTVLFKANELGHLRIGVEPRAWPTIVPIKPAQMGQGRAFLLEWKLEGS